MYLRILKGNTCHNPAGSPGGTGGQFCSSGNDDTRGLPEDDSLYGFHGLYGGWNPITPRSKGGMHIDEEYLLRTYSNFDNSGWLRDAIAQVEREAKERHFPLDKIYIKSGKSTFEISGVPHVATGYAFTRKTSTHAKGDIEIYADTLVDSQGMLRTGFPWRLLAHEVTHHKFQAVLDTYDVSVLAAKANLGQSVNLDDPLLQPFLKEHYPIIPAFRKAYVNKSPKKFEKEDGITDYSKEWWKAYLDGTATSKAAFHETLAEYATLSKFDKPSKSTWTELYNLVERFSKKKGFMEDYFNDFSGKKLADL